MCKGDIEISSLMASLTFLAPPLLAATSFPTGSPTHLYFGSRVRVEFGAEQCGNTKEAVPRKERGYSRKKEKTAAMDDLRVREAWIWALLIQPGMAVGS